MSVINNVLNGLDSKPAVFTPIQFDRTQTIRRKKSVFRPLNVLIITGLLIAISYLVWFQTQIVQLESQSIPVVNILQEAAPAPGESVTGLDHAGPELVRNESPGILVEKSSRQDSVTGLQINENPDYLELSLQLPQGAQSFLKQSGKNRTVFQITRVSREILIPEISGNRWLRDIVLHEVEGGVEIQFDTLQDVLVETHHQYRGQDYFWIIRLKKPVTEKSQALKERSVAPPVVTAEKTPQNSSLQPGNNSNKEKPEVEEPRRQSVKLQINPVKPELTDIDRLNQAQSSLKDRDWTTAERQLNQLLGSEVDVKARINLLNLYQLQKKKSQMNLLLSESIRQYPDEDGFKVIDARRLFNEEDFLSVIASYQSEQSNREILNMVAISSQRVEQHEKAIAYFQRSLTLDPRQPRSWISMAISQEQNSQFNNALESYQMAQRSGVLNTRLQAFVQTRIQQLGATTQ